MTRGAVANPGSFGASPSAALFQQAVQRMRAGDLEGARRTGAQVLAQDPRHAGALQLLAEVALRTGQTRAGVDLLERIPKSRRGTAVLANLGTAYMALGDLPQAEKHLRRAVASSPQDAKLHFNLGNVLRRGEKWNEAAESYRRSLRLEPRFPEALVNLSAVLFDGGKLEEAESPLREAMALAPERVELNVNLANVLRAKGRREEAEACYRRALEADPGLIPALLGLGTLLETRDADDEAEEILSRVLRLDPASGGAHDGLGAICEKRRHWEAAVSHYRGTLEANPNDARSWCKLSDVLERAGRGDEAEDCYQCALAITPTTAAAWEERGQILYNHGHGNQACAAWRRVLEHSPDNAAVHTAVLLLTNYQPSLAQEEVFGQHLAWGKRHADRLERMRIEPDADPGRRLRVGYVSKDFRQHSVGYFIEPVLAHHDRGRFEVFCYHGTGKGDEVTRRMQGCADAWRDTHRYSDAEMAQCIRDDRIDLLVDLNGHTHGSRLLVFARRPAPVQVTWIGYCNTTGMRQMDYRLTDALVDPPGDADRLHTEKLVRLPGCFSVYQPPVEAPEVAPLPWLREGRVTFGCFNNPDKLNPLVLDLWTRILGDVPGSRLLLKGYMNRVAAHEREMREAFSERGIAGERVVLLPRTEGVAEHLACYGRVDIALDPFPYNGVTTTCEALWMGVPVIALAGDRHAGRTGLTLLTHAGVPELVARTPEEYLALAVGMARDRARLEAYRFGLRERMAASPLTDAAGFTRQLEDAYRSLWRQYCEQGGAK